MMALVIVVVVVVELKLDYLLLMMMNNLSIDLIKSRQVTRLIQETPGFQNLKKNIQIKHKQPYYPHYFPI